MDLRQSKEWGKYLETLGWKSEGSIRIRPLLFFSIIKYQRPSSITQKDLEEIKKVAREYRALFAKIEPVSEAAGQGLMANGFKRDKWPLLPPKTIIIDLSPSLEKIKASFKKDTRYGLRKAKENQLEVSVYCSSPSTGSGQAASRSRELSAFYYLWKQTAKRGGFYIPSEKEFLGKVRCLGKKGFFAFVETPQRGVSTEKILAAAFVAIHDNACYYLHAASSREGQKLSAPYLCLWEVIKLAKSQGCRQLDLEGIYDPRFKNLTRKWQGFTHFKRGWGGREVAFPGAYTKYLPAIF